MGGNSVLYTYRTCARLLYMNESFTIEADKGESIAYLAQRAIAQLIKNKKRECKIKHNDAIVSVYDTSDWRDVSDKMYYVQQIARLEAKK